MKTSRTNAYPIAYGAPHIEDLGDLVALTAQGKPCVTPDGMSGTDGNMSGHECKGVGS